MWAKRRQRLTAATIANARAIRASVRLDQRVGSLIQVTDTILQGLWCSGWPGGGVHRLSGAAHHGPPLGGHWAGHPQTSRPFALERS